MINTENVYILYIIIVLELVILLCIIIGLFQFIDIRLNCQEYLNYKINYNSDIETYQKKIVELLNEKDELHQINNSLIDQLNKLKEDLDKLENAYMDVEHDNAMILHNYISYKEKKV